MPSKEAFSELNMNLRETLSLTTERVNLQLHTA
jgi:hypothetical protein